MAGELSPGRGAFGPGQAADDEATALNQLQPGKRAGGRAWGLRHISGRTFPVSRSLALPDAVCPLRAGGVAATGRRRQRHRP